MKRALLSATLLAVSLLLSGGAAADDTSHTSAQADSNRVAVAVADNRATKTSGEGANALSTLGALALGIIGLVWARRHVAEL